MKSVVNDLEMCLSDLQNKVSTCWDIISAIYILVNIERNNIVNMYDNVEM